jgi:hypothetical protein
MTAFESPWHNLVPYDRSRNASGAQTKARVERTQSGALTFNYALRAEMLHVRIPPARSPGPADGLWNHTCFEAFIAAPGTGAYYELNFSPAGQWAAYRFDSYRKGMSPLAVTTPPELVVRHGEDGLELDATISLHELSPLPSARTLKLALTAVIEDDSGTLSYWALKHAPDKPDFHHSDGFVLELPL